MKPRRLLVSILSFVIGVGIVVWWVTREDFPRVPLDDRVAGWREGYQHAHRLMQDVDPGAACTSVCANLRQAPDGFEAAAFDLFFTTASGKSYIVGIDNTSRAVMLKLRGEGLRVDELRKLDPSACTPIDWDTVAVDISDLARLVEEQGKRLGAPRSKANIFAQLVWEKGRQVATISFGFEGIDRLSLAFDASTGEVLRVHPRTGSATSQSTTKPR